MPKARFTSLDLRCVVRDIQSKLTGLRVANVYDLNTKTYLLKLAKPDSKVFLVIESGVRIHSTNFSREHKDVPSIFTLKLRKAIRAKRLEKVTQYGFDRVIDLTFGSGESEHHIICEFYAGGNIVLTDASYKIMALLRTYKSEDGLMNISIGEKYPTNPQQQLIVPSVDQINHAIQNANPNTVIRDVLAKHFVIGTEMIDECLLECGINGRSKVAQFDGQWTPKLIESFQNALKFAESTESHPGYVVYTTAEDRALIEKKAPKKTGKKAQTSEATQSEQQDIKEIEKNVTSTPTNVEVCTLASLADRTDIFYENFVPFKFLQYSSLKFIEFPEFDSAVDEYFSKIESQKVEAQRMEQESVFSKRLDKVREDNEKRVQALVDAETRARQIASLIEKNVAIVDVVIETINGYLSKQVPWPVLADLVKQQKKKGDPIASIIHKLKLEQNAVVVLLYEPEEAEYEGEDYVDQDDENNDENNDNNEERIRVDKQAVREPIAVEIDLGLSAHKNSTKYFSATKKATEKKQKTLDAANVAIKRAERKVRSDLKEVKLKASIQKLRSPYWFEKFNWFITSEGFIVVSGRDMQQNELLYKRYLAKGDAYIHADVHGASTCIVKNPTSNPIPPRTLSEAGTLSVCHSAAWKNRVLTSAWWVEENQVSKTAPTGEYLSTGSFMIRGKKNFLPPSGLVMGFGILFRLADESIAAHVKESTEDDIRREKERKNAERDIQGQLKYGEGQEAQKEEESMVDIGGSDSDSGSDFEDNNETKTSEKEDHDDDGDGNGNEEAGEEAQHDQHENQDDQDKHHDDQHDDHHESESEDSDQEDQKFAVNLAHNDDDDDDAALLNEADQASSTSVASTSQTEKSGKKYISKHDRKRMKKAADRGVETVERGPKPAKKAAAPVAPPAKKKKIPKKYRHQDEEERKAAMELLGSVGQPKATAKESAKVTGTKGKISKTEVTQDTKQRIEARQKAQAAQLAKDKEEEEIRLLMKEEKLEQLSEADLEKLRETSAKGLGVNLSALTGRPRADDILLYAMAVCAPYEALSEYKYKIKITPGNFKKGKSAKLAINAFLHQPEASEREKELIKSIPETELAMTMISNAKLQMAGLSNIIKKK